MHILIVTQYFWPESFRINDIAEEMVRRGHKVTVLTGIPNYPEGYFYSGYTLLKPLREEYKGVIIKRVPVISRGKSRGVRLFFNYLLYVISGCLFGIFRCHDSYDVILAYQTSPITQAIPALLLKVIKRIPVVLYVQDLWPESLSATGAINTPWVLRLVSGLVKFIYKRCDSIWVQSKAFIERVTALNNTSNNIQYIPNTAENLYKPVTNDEIQLPKVINLPSGFLLMFAGNIGAAQDFPAILAAVEKLRDIKDIHFIILGDGSMKKWVEEEVTKRGLGQTFHLLGRYPVETMPHFFASSDVLLMSLSNDPIFALTIPSKLQSYMACGKPIVAMINGEGARVVVEANTGFAVSAGDSDALVNAITKLYHMTKVERQQLGINGKRYFDQNFERTLIMNQIESKLLQISQTGK